MPKSRQEAGDVAAQRPMQPNLCDGSTGGFGTTGLTPEVLRGHNKLAFLEQEVAQEVLTNIVPPTFHPKVHVDIRCQFLLRSDDLGSWCHP